MKIAFLCLYGTVDFFQIGGMESFSRRLASGLIERGHQVGFVWYGAPADTDQRVDFGINLAYRKTLKDACATLARDYDQVVTIYLHPAHRLQYLLFRRLQRRKISFHQMYDSWPDSAIKRKTPYIDARLYPFNGRILCISPRIYRYVRTWSNRAVLFLPPVPESYFLKPEVKPKTDKVRVTYIGRTEPAKGIDDVIELFQRLKNHPEIEMEIHGFHHQHVPISVEIHEWLSRQQGLRYFYTPFKGYTPAVDENLRGILRDTDILILPYRLLSSTMDTPLLLLEGMASLCAVVTRRSGDIPEIYGPGPFLLPGTDDLGFAANQILQARSLLPAERERIHSQNMKLAFGADLVTDRFIEAVS